MPSNKWNLKWDTTMHLLGQPKFRILTIPNTGEDGALETSFIAVGMQNSIVTLKNSLVVS